MNDTQAKVVIAKTEALFERLNELIDIKKVKLKELEEKYDELIRNVEESLIPLADNICSLYYEKDGRMIWDCCDDLTEGIDYLTLSSWHKNHPKRKK